MKIRFWGVRGSIPTPGPHTIKYGGNTTCIEIRTDEDQLIILDGGSGIYMLAQQLAKKMPLEAHIFITHTHWDHIHGLPFFTPLFVPGNEITLYGGFDIVAGRGIEHAMTTQFQYSYFPVREAELKANLNYQTIRADQPIKIGDATITPTLMNHPVLNFGYRIESNNKSIFFTGDHEPRYNIAEPSDPTYQEYQRMLEEQEQLLVSSMHGVDMLIADSSYTEEEYESKKGWGHGTFGSSLELAKKAKAKQLYFTHHEPTRSDEELESVFDGIKLQYPQSEDNVEYHLAMEGIEIEV